LNLSLTSSFIALCKLTVQEGGLRDDFRVTRLHEELPSIVQSVKPGAWTSPSPLHATKVPYFSGTKVDQLL
jgi:hypothetical protein